MKLAEPPDTMKQLPALAERLGVKAHDTTTTGVSFKGPDNKFYDMFELISAFLDRLDEKSK